MRLKPRDAVIVSLLAPLPLVSGLALLSGVLPFLFAGSYLFSGLCLVSFFLLLAATIKAQGTEIQTAGWGSLGVLGIAGGAALYLLGSYLGLALLHWAALVVLYDAIVLYVGGMGLLRVALIPSMALLPLAFPSMLALDVITVVALIGGNVVSAVILLGWYDSTARPSCPELRHYTAPAQAHCLYCGNKIGNLTLTLAGRRIAKVAVLSAVLLGASTIPVQAIEVQSGVPYLSTYSVSGLVSSSRLSVTAGWTVIATQASVQGGLSFARLVLANNGQKVVVVMASSPSSIAAVKAISNVSTTANLAGSVSLGNALSAQLVVDSTNSSFWGMQWVSSTGSLNGTQLLPLTLAYMAVENLGSPPTNETGLSVVTAASLTQLHEAQQWELPISDALSTWNDVGSYVTMAGAVLLIGFPFEAARRQDSERARCHENILWLSDREQGALAIISKSPPGTGMELHQYIGSRLDYSDRAVFVDLLLKLEGLGLISRLIRKSRGGSILMWKSRIST